MNLREAAEAVVRLWVEGERIPELPIALEHLRAALAAPDELAEARSIVSALLMRDSLSTNENRSAGLRALNYLKRTER